MKKPRPYPIYAEAQADADGYWPYLMEDQDPTLTLADHEERARIIRAAPLLLDALEQGVRLDDKDWADEKKNSARRKWLRLAHEAINTAILGTEEDRENETDDDTPIEITPIKPEENT